MRKSKKIRLPALFHRSWKFSSKSFSISRFIIKLSSPAHSFSTACVSVYKSNPKLFQTAHFAITKRIAKTNASKLLVGAFIWLTRDPHFELMNWGIPTSIIMDHETFHCIRLCQICFQQLPMRSHGSPILGLFVLRKEGIMHRSLLFSWFHSRSQFSTSFFRSVWSRKRERRSVRRKKLRKLLRKKLHRRQSRRHQRRRL